MWGANWGEMTWGGGVASATTVPISAWALVTLGVVIGVIGTLASRNRSMRVFSIMIVSLLPALAVALALPHTFTNGTIADANQVNANFSAIVGLAPAIQNVEVEILGLSADGVTTRCVASGFTNPDNRLIAVEFGMYLNGQPDELQASVGWSRPSDTSDTYLAQFRNYPEGSVVTCAATPHSPLRVGQTVVSAELSLP